MEEIKDGPLPPAKNAIEAANAESKPSEVVEEALHTDSSDDDDGSSYSEHDKVTKPKRSKSKWPPKFLADFEASEKHRYIEAIAKLTDNYAKTFVDIKFEPDLAQPPLSFLSKNDIIQIIKVGRQKV